MRGRQHADNHTTFDGKCGLYYINRRFGRPQDIVARAITGAYPGFERAHRRGAESQPTACPGPLGDVGSGMGAGEGSGKRVDYRNAIGHQVHIERNQDYMWRRLNGTHFDGESRRSPFGKAGRLGSGAVSWCPDAIGGTSNLPGESRH